jgi:uncharacterized protein
MRIVLDTNVLLISIPAKSQYYPIFYSLTIGKLDLLINQDIYLEYLEMLEQRGNQFSINLFNKFILEGPNIQLIDSHFQWNLIPGDPDDNKFSDCAINGNADYLVTNDAHFNVLKSISFPRVNVTDADSFLKIIEII